MKAIKYYRPFAGDYTTRLAFRVLHFCRDLNIELFSFENNQLVPLKGFFTYLRHLEFSDYPDVESEYVEKSVVILCILPENEDALQEIFIMLRENEKRYEGHDIPHYGHPELIDIQTDQH